MTFVRVRLWLEAAPIGAELAVLLDYEPATRSIPRSLHLLGQRMLGLETSSDGQWVLRLRKDVADPTERCDDDSGGN